MTTLIPIIKESDFKKELEWAAKVYGNTLHKHLDEIVDKHDSSQLALLEGLMKIYKEQTSNQVIQSLEESITYLKSLK